MPVSTTDLDNLPDYTTAQQLKAAKYARVTILTGAQAYGENGRNAQRAALDAINRTIATLEQQLAEESVGADGGDALVVTGDPI